MHAKHLAQGIHCRWNLAFLDMAHIKPAIAFFHAAAKTAHSRAHAVFEHFFKTGAILALEVDLSIAH